MTSFEWTITVLTTLSVLCIPLIVIALRGMRKWTQTEEKLKELVDDVRELVASKKADHEALAMQMHRNSEAEKVVHGEILAQMRTDREATDRRLRFVEEYWMRKGQN